MNTNDIVQKLWNLCHVLRDDGVTYHQYVTELTWLLFLKMMEETAQQSQLPEGYRWDDLRTLNEADRLDFYRLMLVHLGSHGSDRVKAIFANASTFIKRPKNLHILIQAIDDIDWFDDEKGHDREQLGDLYEGLLEKNANEKKSGAGQYFTPRPLIECMVRLVKPQVGEIVQDPACGTGGFLIAADAYIKQSVDFWDLTTAQQEFQMRQAFVGVELVQDAHRLCLMNLMLHDIESDVLMGDTLSPDGTRLPQSHVVLANPPFGTKRGGGGPTRDDFTFVTSNKQLAFLQHIYRGLLPGGRAAVVLPDNVLFEAGVGAKIRADLMDKCDLHTILRLPTGIFYAGGVKTNVLFFTRGERDEGSTEGVWVYDMRTNQESFGKRNPLTLAHFDAFCEAFGDDPLGTAARTDEGEEGRWRRFSREEIRERGDNLDITWLRDDSIERAEDLPDPEDIAAEIMDHLRTALEEMDALTDLLAGDAEAGELAGVST